MLEHTAKRRAASWRAVVLLLLMIASTLVHVETITVKAELGWDIDLYGGAANYNINPLAFTYNSTQYGPNYQFPAPYGGQGPNMPMDLVLPQSQVYLWTNVTYESSPVSNRLVAFEIQEPDGTVYTALSSSTEQNGVAGVTFRMPWPSTNPESLFGVWTVTATVSVADQQVNDTMQFEYDYLVHIWKVTTDNNQYVQGQPVFINVYYGSHAMQYYPVFFIVSIVNADVTLGSANVSTVVGNATGVFSQYTSWNATVTTQIPYWAKAEYATVYTNGFDKEPTAGGVTITPEYVGPTIEIVIIAPLEFPVTFAQAGLDSTAVGTVVTVNGAFEEFADLPFTVLVENGSSVTYSYSSIVSSSTVGKEFTLTGIVGPSSPVTVKGPVNVTGNYKVAAPQNAVMFKQVGVGLNFAGTVLTVDDTPYKITELPVSFYWQNGSTHTFAYKSPLTVGANAEQYVWTSTTGLSTLQSESITITASGTITGNYKTQYHLTVTSSYDSPFPPSGWFDTGSTLTESVTSPVSGGSGVQYVCTGWTGTGSVPASSTASSVTFVITQASNIDWNWKTQYQVTFSEFGVGPEFVGTVVTVDGVNYAVDGLPVSFWWEKGSSHSFSFASPLTVNASKQYSWVSTSGLSNLQSGALTVTTSGSVVANYAVKLLLVLMVPLWLTLAFLLGAGIVGACVLLLFLEMYKRRKRKKPARRSYTIIAHLHV